MIIEYDIKVDKKNFMTGKLVAESEEHARKLLIKKCPIKRTSAVIFVNGTCVHDETGIFLPRIVKKFQGKTTKMWEKP
jgi:hypothetical protein